MKKTNAPDTELDLNVLLGIRRIPKPPRAKGRLPQLNKFYRRMAAVRKIADDSHR